MLDEERGTYSPPTEDNLSYESRRPAGSRDQAPITLIVSGILLVVLLLAVVLFYNSGMSNHGKVPPDVGDTVGDFKDTKVEDAKPLTDQDMVAPDATSGDAGDAKFAQSTEAPALRDSTTTAPPVSEAPPAVTPKTGPLPSQTGNAALGPTTDAPPATSPQASLTPSKAVSATAAPVAKLASTVAKTTPVTKTAPVVTAPAVANVASAPVSGASVQIGAFTSTDIANQQYNSVANNFAPLLAGTAKHVEKVQTGAGATLYRTSFTGFATKDKAHAFCSALKAAGRDCFVK